MLFIEFLIIYMLNAHIINSAMCTHERLIEETYKKGKTFSKVREQTNDTARSQINGNRR